MEQEIQEAKSLYYSYKQYFSDYLPALTKLGLKVVMALLVFVGGRKVIQWFVSFIKKSMERASVDKGVIQFTGSLLRIVLYILLVFSIATHFGVKESSIAALLGVSFTRMTVTSSGASTASSTIRTFAPFATTSGTNLWPSTTAPRIQIKREPSSTFRES